MNSSWLSSRWPLTESQITVYEVFETAICLITCGPENRTNQIVHRNLCWQSRVGGQKWILYSFVMMAQNFGPNTSTKWRLLVYFQTDGQTQGLEVGRLSRIIQNNSWGCATQYCWEFFIFFKSRIWLTNIPQSKCATFFLGHPARFGDWGWILPCQSQT